MVKKKVYFFGILANISLSVLKVKLQHGFKIREIERSEGINLLSQIEGLSYGEIQWKLIKLRCLVAQNSNIYIIKNSFNGNFELRKDGSLMGLPKEFSSFFRNSQDNYLGHALQLMRLYKGGNICMPLYYYFYFINSYPKGIYYGWTSTNVLHGSYALDKKEVRNLNKFIRDVEFPFNYSYLQLAFENYDSSYQHDKDLSFLLLMTSLEALFNRDGIEIRKTISRNTAVLLGRNKLESEQIFQEMKKLYDKRSAIIHGGKSNITDKELLQLRQYVRESIKEVHIINKDKDKLLDLLNSCGFGNRPWK